MTARTRRLVPALLAAMLVVGTPALTACGQAAESIVENAAGAAAGGDVDIEDGQVTVQDSEGNNFAAGDNVDLPDSWPSAVPVPDGGTLISVMTSADSTTANAIWTVEASQDDAGKAYGDQLTGAGFTADSTQAVAGMVGGQYTGNDLKVNVVVLDADGKTSIMVNVEPATE